MTKFNWLKTMDVHLRVLRWVGAWPEGDGFYKRDFYTVYAIITAILCIGSHNLPQIINIFLVYSDLQALAKTIFVETTNLLAVMKIYFFVRNLRTIKKFFVALREDQFQPRNQRQIDIVRVSLKNWRALHIFFVIFVWMILSSWALNPYFHDGIKDYELPFDAWYPFNVKQSPNYEIMYAYQLVCMWPLSMCNIHLDSFIIAVMMYIWCQCDILCDDLRHLKGEENFGENLIKCVKHHKEIVRFAEESNNFFSLIALGQMATSTIVLALTMFQLALIDPLSGEAMGHLLYITGLIIQILMYCWYGNQVEIKSSEIVYALFESDWISQPESIKKSLLIFSLRCQKPIQMSAINLFILSLDTFVKILRSAWSYFAVLHSVND